MDEKGNGTTAASTFRSEIEATGRFATGVATISIFCSGGPV
ncbi:hypothetical protein RvY_05024 [Ramazzottius varieornatus]|uniref:Uncharacterized protein n=1 Tax=Ramazzottius varieornatus TaxID=947166 RepID=A0A1D1UTM0_RAMVA|nr:hypothetical protein RvY_05024 [Ramazzottius varieornatus]